MRRRFLSFALLQCCSLAGCAGSEKGVATPVLAEPIQAVSPESAEETPPATPALSVFEFLRAKYDADGDGRISPGEYRRSAEAFARLDSDRDGGVTPADFGPEWTERPFPQGFVYGEGGPELGDPAPDFRLSSTRGETIELSSFRGEKPVVLVFGSFT